MLHYLSSRLSSRFSSRLSSRQSESTPPLALARLDDALLLLRDGVAPSARLDPAAVEPLRRSLDRCLAAVAVTSAAPREADPSPVPDLAALRAACIPVVADEEFTERGGRRRAGADAGGRSSPPTVGPGPRSEHRLQLHGNRRDRADRLILQRAAEGLVSLPQPA